MIEHTAIFVATMVEMVMQFRSTCGNVNYECNNNADCPKYPPVGLGKCGADNLCEELGWCPPLDNFEDNNTPDIVPTCCLSCRNETTIADTRRRKPRTSATYEICDRMTKRRARE